MEALHKSQISSALMCKQKYFIQHVIGSTPTQVNESSLLGNAMHTAIDLVMKREIDWDLESATKAMLRNFIERKTKSIKEGISVNDDAIDLEDYKSMLKGYLEKEYNYYATPVLLESQFSFYIKVGRKSYPFAGTIDQLIKVDKRYLPYPMSSAADEWEPKKDYVYLHRDIKTGKVKKQIDYMTDVEVYSYALAYGWFLINSKWVRVGLIPFMHAIYFVQDHIPYKKAVPQKGAFKGDERGPGMYGIHRSIDSLSLVKERLVQYYQYCNTGPYVRNGMASHLCNTCVVRNICESTYGEKIDV